MTDPTSFVGPEGPCTSCEYKRDCPAYSKLFPSLFSLRSYKTPAPLDRVDIALDELVTAFISAMKSAEGRGVAQIRDRGLYLSALFDFAVTAVYSNNLVAESGDFSQPAFLSEATTAIFPYTWMDPIRLAAGVPLIDCYLPGARREASRDYPITDLLAKPGGRFIGDVGIKVLKSIVRKIIATTRPEARLRDGGGLRGEFDLTLTDSDHMVFIEVKAKPLVAYPLRLSLKAGDRQPLTWSKVAISDVENIDVFLAATDSSIPISIPNCDGLSTWPLNDLTRQISDPTVFELVIKNWSEHLSGYRQWDGEARATRWHRFGCGNFSVVEDGVRVEKRVANTKELPGLDRTDDIKKGAAQILKFSRFKFDCRMRAIRCVLMGNTHSETHAADYIDPLLKLKILHSEDTSKREEWLFDAVVGLTRNDFNNTQMRTLFNLDLL
jgi:hypothetical protein